MAEFFRVLRKSIELAEDFEDYYKRTFCKDLDSGEPDLNASFYKINNPDAANHPVQIVSEHSAHCLSNPVKQAFGVKLPLDVRSKADPKDRILSFSGAAHCELQVSSETELRRIVKTIYDRGKVDYSVTRDQILSYVDGRQSHGDSEWTKLFKQKKGWKKDLIKWRRKQIVM